MTNQDILPIRYVNLAQQWRDERAELLPILESVLATGQYVGGNYIDEFERAVAELLGIRYAVAVNSGTDALMLGLKAIGVGRDDEVITPPNSFIASTSAIVHVGARPVFVDVGEDQNIDPDQIEIAITERTKAIMPVHLTGRIARMDAICQIAAAHGIPIIEDAAQAIGSRYQGRYAGTWGTVGCFSAHPLKNLNALGDAGFIVTEDEEAADLVRKMRNHGLTGRDTVTEFGLVSRMDALKAAALCFRLKKLEDVIHKRRLNSARLREMLNPRHVFIPEDSPFEFNTYHTFVIQVDHRDALRSFLNKNGIETAIHYPVPIHLQPAAKSLGYQQGDFPRTEMQSERILTLPVNQTLSLRQVDFVASKVNEFFTLCG